jgi:hypothetical protein
MATWSFCESQTRQGLAEGGWLVRPAGRQGRNHGDSVSLDAVHLLFDLCEFWLQGIVVFLSVGSRAAKQQRCQPKHADRQEQTRSPSLLRQEFVGKPE